MIILGIETSCDETALALIETQETTQKNSRPEKVAPLKYRIIGSLVHSQAELHSAYGGVFPTLAKREHSKNLIPLLHKLLNESELNDIVDTNIKNPQQKTLSDKDFETKLSELTKLFAEKNPDLMATIGDAHFLKKIPKIDMIAVTEGPGLEPALWVGINFAHILSKFWNIPIVPINHMEGHIVGSLLQSDKPYGTWQELKELPLPAVALLISGGHTELVNIESGFKYSILGQTKDDAVGEAFDKVARLLELPYPGGPHVSRLAYEAREKNIATPVKLPRPMINSGDCNFSFSGLKTAVLYALKKAPTYDKVPGLVTPDDFKAGLAREFEDSVAETLDSKLRRAIDEQSAKAIIVGGGVSANRLLRERFSKTATEYGIPIFLPDHHVSGDNALMIALAAAVNNSPHTVNIHANGTKSLV